MTADSKQLLNLKDALLKSKNLKSEKRKIKRFFSLFFRFCILNPSVFVFVSFRKKGLVFLRFRYFFVFVFVNGATLAGLNLLLGPRSSSVFNSESAFLEYRTSNYFADSQSSERKVSRLK